LNRLRPSPLSDAVGEVTKDTHSIASIIAIGGADSLCFQVTGFTVSGAGV
jgi:hypothetical protein